MEKGIELREACLFVCFLFFKMGQITAFLYADGSDPIKKEKILIHERED